MSLKHQSRSGFTSSARAAHSGRAKAGMGDVGGSGQSSAAYKSSASGAIDGLPDGNKPRLSTRIYRDGAASKGRS